MKNKLLKIIILSILIIGPFLFGGRVVFAQTYKGCWTDDVVRALPNSAGYTMSINNCILWAKNHGFSYAGLQYYGQCFAGNTLRYTQVSDAECNTPCTYSSSGGYYCGGAYRNSIYTSGGIFLTITSSGAISGTYSAPGTYEVISGSSPVVTAGGWVGYSVAISGGCTASGGQNGASCTVSNMTTAQTVTVTYTYATNNASCTSVTAPASVSPGQTFPVTVVMQNNGTSTWTSSGTPYEYDLSTSTHSCPGTWNFCGMAMPSNVAPTQAGTFNFNVTAPSTVGTRTLGLQMLQQNVAWFGAVCSKSISVIIDTTPPTAPGIITTSWAGDHYVNTNFTAATTGSTDSGLGIRGYRLCRSIDNVGGCYYWTANGEHAGLTEVVSGADLPSPGTFRYYYWYAYDNAGNQSSNSPDQYVRMDATVPDISNISATPATAAKGSTVRFYVTASDAGIGLNTSNALFYLGTMPYNGWNRVSAGTMTWANGQYYYDVVLNDPYGTTYRAWSYVYDAFVNQGSRDEYPTEFTITNTPPPISTPISPGNGATVNGNGSNITFTTNAVTDVDGQTVQYYFRVATGASGEAGVVCNSGYSTSTSYSCNPGVGTFYWHVYTYDGVAEVPGPVWSFTIATYTLTIPASGGTGSGTYGGTAAGAKNYGTAVSVTATASTGSTFTNWVASCDNNNQTTSPCSFTMTGNASVQAVYTLNTYTLTIPASGGTGSGTYGGTAAGSKNYGTAVSITATPSAGSTFTSWTASGAAAAACNGSTTSPCAFTMTGIASVQAIYALNTYTVNSTGTVSPGGQITPSSRTGISPGANTTFTVTPDTGYIASASGCNNGSLSGTPPNLTYTTGAINADCTVTATFTSSAVVCGACALGSGPLRTGAHITGCTAGGSATNLLPLQNAYTWSCGGASCFELKPLN